MSCPTCRVLIAVGVRDWSFKAIADAIENGEFTEDSVRVAIDVLSSSSSVPIDTNVQKAMSELYSALQELQDRRDDRAIQHGDR